MRWIEGCLENRKHFGFQWDQNSPLKTSSEIRGVFNKDLLDQLQYLFEEVHQTSQSGDQSDRESSEALCSVLFLTLCRSLFSVGTQRIQVCLHLTQHGLQQAQTGLVSAERGNRGTIQLQTTRNTLPYPAGVTVDPAWKTHTEKHKKPTTHFFCFFAVTVCDRRNKYLPDITWRVKRHLRVQDLRNQDWRFLLGFLWLALSGPNTLNSHCGIESWNKVGCGLYVKKRILHLIKKYFFPCDDCMEWIMF